MTFKNELITVGVISAAHGIKGEVIIKSFTVPKNNICTMQLFDSKNNPVKITFFRTNNKQDQIGRMLGISDRTAAEKLKGFKLFTLRSDMPALNNDEFYIEDLIGLKTVDINYKEVGIIKSAYNFGGGDIIEIKLINGDLELYPFTKEIFVSLTKDHVVFVQPNISK